jgi:hypothetical protein
MRFPPLGHAAAHDLGLAVLVSLLLLVSHPLTTGLAGSGVIFAVVIAGLAREWRS